jgi:hypothetical protein
MILGDRLNLEQVSKRKEADLLIRNTLKRGVAWRFIDDILRWAKRQKRCHYVEQY